MKLTFDQWKERVDRAMEAICGVSCDDLPDWDYYMAWVSGYTPAQAAREALEAAKNF